MFSWWVVVSDANRTKEIMLEWQTYVQTKVQRQSFILSSQKEQLISGISVVCSKSYPSCKHCARPKASVCKWYWSKSAWILLSLECHDGVYQAACITLWGIKISIPLKCSLWCTLLISSVCTVTPFLVVVIVVPVPPWSWPSLYCPSSYMCPLLPQSSSYLYPS